jgi:UPF0288 family protein (methanogenesis marker protein 3)
MLQVENTQKRLNKTVSKVAVWKIMVNPDLYSSREEESNQYEVVLSASGFDPTQCSPPNSFMDKLKQRMDIYYK